MKKQCLLISLGCIMASACSTKSTRQISQEVNINKISLTRDSTYSDIGKRFTDFSLPNTEGKEVKLSQLVAKNRYTLVTFWDSTYDPSLHEIPHIARAYDDFHNRGLGIVSIALDKDEFQWKAAIREYHMIWDHLSDLKGSRCKAAQLYHVINLPSTILIDQNGVIIARDLKGEQLENKMMELMGC